MDKRASILIISFIIGLIFFDAAQQKYYLDTFDLNETGSVSFVTLLSNHLIRWALWAIVNVPIGLLLWKKTFQKGNLTNKRWTGIGLTIFVSILISLCLVSLHSLFSQSLGLTDFFSFYEFFLFQKGLTFFMASTLMVLWLYNHSKVKTISNQSIEIKNLKRKTSDLQQTINQEKTPHLNVKTGYKLKPVPLEEIIWIQSDDYCVKIHTESNSFTLRQSLKTLAEKLAPYRFIRIHRSALLNLDYLDQVNFETAKVRLLNETEIPISKTGVKSLKLRIKDVSG
ncbi:LytTR family DNA-binding domain-containing protein [Ekhidna sp.]|uniref:LytR/AlgR family response regulator transcription factor n=1 Tax=Ekhidna sp. TaxID=2608089 RepID=UPI00329836A8